MSTSIYWTIYKTLYNPPGTPQDLRCVACKAASAGVCFTIMAGSIYGLKRTFKNNVYTGTAFGLGAFAFGITGVMALRFAYDDNRWNEAKVMEVAKERKKQRQQTAQSDQSMAQV